MLIGVPREIKNHEYRIGLTPAGVRETRACRPRSADRDGGGAAIGFDDEQYTAPARASRPMPPRCSPRRR
jgi:alanine dehydrogenase